MNFKEYLRQSLNEQYEAGRRQGLNEAGGAINPAIGSMEKAQQTGGGFGMGDWHPGYGEGWVTSLPWDFENNRNPATPVWQSGWSYEKWLEWRDWMNQNGYGV